MGKVSLESSNRLSVLGNAICDIKDEMQDNLSILNKAFSAACENWQDKNAQTCQNALSGHNDAMRLAFRRLSDVVNAVARLSKLAAEYEEI